MLCLCVCARVNCTYYILSETLDRPQRSVWKREREREREARKGLASLGILSIYLPTRGLGDLTRTRKELEIPEPTFLH